MKRFNRIHAICTYLRKDEACLRCPAREGFGPGMRSGVRGCYVMAREVVNIAQHGNPWGKGSKSAAKWRKRVFKKLVRATSAEGPQS